MTPERKREALRCLDEILNTGQHTLPSDVSELIIRARDQIETPIYQLTRAELEKEVQELRDKIAELERP